MLLIQLCIEILVESALVLIMLYAPSNAFTSPPPKLPNRIIKKERRPVFH